MFQDLLDLNLNTDICLGSEEDINEAVEHVNYVIQQSVWKNSPENKTI